VKISARRHSLTDFILPRGTIFLTSFNICQGFLQLTFLGWWREPCCWSSHRTQFCLDQATEHSTAGQQHHTRSITDYSSPRTTERYVTWPHDLELEVFWHTVLHWDVNWSYQHPSFPLPHLSSPLFLYLTAPNPFRGSGAISSRNWICGMLVVKSGIISFTKTIDVSPLRASNSANWNAVSCQIWRGCRASADNGDSSRALLKQSVVCSTCILHNTTATYELSVSLDGQ